MKWLFFKAENLAYIISPVILMCMLALLVAPAGIAHACGRLDNNIGNVQLIESSLNSPSISALNTNAEDNTLLQFTSAGHVLGFGEQAVYLAGLDHALRVEFAGGSPVQPVAESAGIEQDSATPLGRVCYGGVWENIDVIFSAAAGGIAESTYIIHPGGDQADISLSYNVPLAITPQGGLRFSFENGYLTESAPIAWQEISGQRLPVNVRFIQQGERQVGFTLDGYDARHAIYIDPTYAWHTFHGSVSGSELAQGIVLDTSGNIYLAGSSGKTWDGPGGQPPLHSYTSTQQDITIVKLNSAGVYQWHTFYGSAFTDYGHAIAIDASANVYIAGRSDLVAWTGPTGQSPKHGHSGGMDIAIIKLNTAGAYQWHTFWGSINFDYAEGITLDSSGNIYVAGGSYAGWGSPIDPFKGATSEITILKLDNAGNYLWHTFHGSTTSQDLGNRIVVDSAANIYVTGYSLADWNGPTGQLPRNNWAGFWDMVIIKLNSEGAYQWHTFYGSSNEDQAFRIALDTAANIYVTGYSKATWNGPTGQTPLNTFAGTNNLNITILKLDSAGDYQWHTFYGSAVNSDQGWGIAVDSGANIYITGKSEGTWNGPTGQTPLNGYTADSDIPIIKLNSDGAYQWHSFYGGTATDIACDIALSSGPTVYAAGLSRADWLGPGSIPPVNFHTAGTTEDITVIRINDAQPTQSVSTATGTGTATFTTSNGSMTGLTAAAATPCGTPPYYFPHGFFSFTITSITPGSMVTITITLPSPLPTGSQYWKCINGNWVDCTSLLGSNDGDNIITLTITDGGLGDADGIANGIIVDPGGPCVPAGNPGEGGAEGASTGESQSTTIRTGNLRVAMLNVPGQARVNQPITISANVVNGRQRGWQLKGSAQDQWPGRADQDSHRGRRQQPAGHVHRDQSRARHLQRHHGLAESQLRGDGRWCDHTCHEPGHDCHADSRPRGSGVHHHTGIRLQKKADILNTILISIL